MADYSDLMTELTALAKRFGLWKSLSHLTSHEQTAYQSVECDLLAILKRCKLRLRWVGDDLFYDRLKLVTLHFEKRYGWVPTHFPFGTTSLPPKYHKWTRAEAKWTAVRSIRKAGMLSRSHAKEHSRG